MDPHIPQPFTPIVRFSAHIFTGLVLFAVIAFSALAVGWTADYLRASQYPQLLIKSLSLAENFILSVDGLLLVVFLIRSAMSMYLEVKAGDDHE